MSEIIMPKTLLIVEDNPEQLKAFEKHCWGLGLTAYEFFTADRNPPTAYTGEYQKHIWTREEGSTSREAKEEIRRNIAEGHQDLIRNGRRLITMARTYREFESELDLGVDGVVLDMHFPLTYKEPWNHPQPLGIRAGLKLEEAGIPFIINTAWEHHGADSQWIYEMIKERKWPMAETLPGMIKDWKSSLDYIIEAMDEPRK